MSTKERMRFHTRWSKTTGKVRKVGDIGFAFPNGTFSTSKIECNQHRMLTSMLIEMKINRIWDRNVRIALVKMTLPQLQKRLP